MHHSLRSVAELVRLAPLVVAVAFGILQTYFVAVVRPFRR